MVLIQKTIFLFCLASVYAASIQNISSEERTEDSQMTSDEQISEYDPFNEGLVVTETSQSENSYKMGKILVEALLSVFQIVKQMDINEQGLKSVSLIAARMISFLAGRYYEAFKNLMPMISGIAAAVLESLR